MRISSKTHATSARVSNKIFILTHTCLKDQHFKYPRRLFETETDAYKTSIARRGRRTHSNRRSGPKLHPEPYPAHKPGLLVGLRTVESNRKRVRGIMLWFFFFVSMLLKSRPWRAHQLHSHAATTESSYTRKAVPVAHVGWRGVRQIVTELG